MEDQIPAATEIQEYLLTSHFGKDVKFTGRFLAKQDACIRGTTVSVSLYTVQSESDQQADKDSWSVIQIDSKGIDYHYIYASPVKTTGIMHAISEASSKYVCDPDDPNRFALHVGTIALMKKILAAQDNLTYNMQTYSLLKD